MKQKKPEVKLVPEAGCVSLKKGSAEIGLAP